MITHKVVKPYRTSSSKRRIYFIGDIHAGTTACAEDKIRDAVCEIKSDPDALWLGMGDYAEYIGPHDPRWNRKLVADWVDQDDVANSQTEWVVSLLKPIASKCIGLLAGNHEYKFMLHSHDNVHEWLCDRLGQTNLGYSCFINLTFRRDNSRESYSYQGCAVHGGSGATTDVGATNALKKWMMQNHAKWYAYGHVHRIKYQERVVLDMGETGKIKNVQTMGVLTGCFFKTYANGVDPTYGEMRTFEPTTLGYSMIELEIESGSLEFRKKIYTN